MQIIFLLCRISTPAGGHAILIQHVKTLRRIGMDAKIFFGPADFPSFYENEVSKDFQQESLDILEITNTVVVIPEADLAVWAPILLKMGRKYLDRCVILNQNHFYTFNHFGQMDASSIFKNALHIFTSESIKRFISLMNLDSTTNIIPVAINHHLFRPAQKVLQVAYMPRKAPDEARRTLSFFRELAPDLSEIPFVSIDNKRPADVAAIINHSMIFISFARDEGLGMPALEAMAAGCIIIGYTGFGGDEYASDNNGFWIENGNSINFAREVISVIRRCLYNDPLLQQIKLNAITTALRYNLENLDVNLVKTWKDLLTRFEEKNRNNSND